MAQSTRNWSSEIVTMEIIITVIYMCICVVSVGELIERTNCPSTEAEWKSRSIEFCESPQKYHCIYNRDCQLVELCANAKYVNFELYLIMVDSGQEFFIERQNYMYTNSMEYSIIQYNIYCKPKITSTTVSSTTGQRTGSTTVQPNTTVDNRENTIYETPEHCYVGWILFVLVSLAWIYNKWIRKRKNEIPRETETQRKTGERKKFLTPVLEETPVQGRTDKMYFNATLPERLESNNSQNSDIREMLTNYSTESDIP